MDQTAAAAGEHRLPVVFVGSGSEYFRIWIVNLLLTLVTLGLYYPYAKVRRLRYFHGATEVGGQPLSFHADPKKMLRGYLLVAAMVGLYSVAGQVSPTAGLVAFVIVAALWPALWHSSLRFRLANTGWRGLRLRFTGSRHGAYIALAPGFVLVFLLAALGLLADPGTAEAADSVADPAAGRAMALVGTALATLAVLASTPALLWLLRRYQHHHYALGDEVTRFVVPLRTFYGLTLRIGGVGLACMALTVGVMLLAAWALGSLLGGAGSPAAGLVSALGVLSIFAALVVLQAVVWPYAVARMQDLCWNGTRSAQLRFKSRLRYRSLLGLTLKNWTLMLATLGLYYPFAVVATARLRLQAVQVRMACPPETLLGRAARADESAAGDAAGDLLGLDIGL
jgi:uncharacterized membrane protein YjgN (DUF898 family)